VGENKAAEKSNAEFIKKIIKHCKRLRELNPDEVFIFNIIACHGSYQIKVGPEYSKNECKKLGLKAHSRPVEINGTMHNLFIHSNNISPTPNHEAAKNNYKGSIIMKDVNIRIIDKQGKATKVKVEKCDRDGVWARRCINLAGDRGDKIMNKLTNSGKLIIETYLIVQDDILRAIEKKYGS